MDLVDPAYAGRRSVAVLVDLVPPAALLVVGFLVDPPMRWYLLGAAGAWCVMLWLWLARTGQGPGAVLAAVRVVDGRTGRAAPIGAALVRTVFRPLIALGTLGVAGLSYRWDPAGRERTWWDRIAGTRVVAAIPMSSQLGWSDPVARQRWVPPEVVAGIPSHAPATPGFVPLEDQWAGRERAIVSAESGRHNPGADGDLASLGSTGQFPSQQPQNRGVDPRSGTMGPSSTAGPPSAPPVIEAIPRVPAVPAPGPGPVGSVPISAVPSARDVAPDPAADATQQRTAAIRSGPLTLTWDTGRSVLVTGHVLVGRDPLGTGDEKVDRVLAVDLDARGVSKTHLAIDVTPLGVAVTDRHSTNGVRLLHPDGTRVQIEAGKPTPVREGDRIEFGGRWLGIGR
jgi:hypothetical protein